MPNTGFPYNIPLAVPIPGITQSVITFRLDQITRLLFQLFPQATPLFTSDADVKSKAAWDAGMAATDITKLTISPRFASPKISDAKRLEVAGDSNATIDGIPMTFGRGVVRFSGEFLNLDAACLSSMNALFQYSQANTVGGTNLGVWLINGAKPNGMVFRNEDFTFFPIWNFMLGSPGTEGFAAADKTPFAFDMLGNWADNRVCTIPDFDPNSVYTS